ncbi:MAG: MBL fold metallo-hydrolase [Clostridia bacterium]|nr:MBL fold metallo-hydrolase [Clostridia bacterium]MBR1686121.1 MBL fold metallo-hydrolase [Clostridia bacterium]
MELKRLTERIWYYPFEEARDRPNLFYIRGSRWSLAVDAGHSGAHTRAFYRALEEAGLALPALTVLTHWHWDHTFGMHAVHGLTLCNRRTNEALCDFAKQVESRGRAWFLSMHESIAREYVEGEPIVVKTSDLTFEGAMDLDAGDCPVHLFQAPSPHTEDATLIYLPGERTLLYGDATSGPFPNYSQRDPVLARAFADTLVGVDADIFAGSHWVPLTKAEAIAEALE